VISPIVGYADYGVPLSSEHGLSLVWALGPQNMAHSSILIFAALTGMHAASASVSVGLSLGLVFSDVEGRGKRAPQSHSTTDTLVAVHLRFTRAFPNTLQHCARYTRVEDERCMMS
jgi:hypothetical protein